MNAVDVVDRIMEVLFIAGGDFCCGEPITQLQHALQTASLAERDWAPESLVAAALLHDIGHLMPQRPDAMARTGAQSQHEHAGALWLRTSFGLPVTEPIRLHVMAKRYLCSVDPFYLERLSSASRDSLVHQGGPMTVEETLAFAKLPWAPEAVELRRWDDAAKVPGVAVPDLSRYRPLLERLIEVP